MRTSRSDPSVESLTAPRQLLLGRLLLFPPFPRLLTSLRTIEGRRTADPTAFANAWTRRRSPLALCLASGNQTVHCGRA